MIEYKVNIKEKPEYFIVVEKSDLQFNDEGKFYLYQLIKKGFNTLDIAKKYKLSYAGLKDKNAITFQYVSSRQYLGNLIKHKEKDRFYFLIYMGKISKNLKIGMLQGNFFSIKTPFEVNYKPEYFINYYDTQRVKFSNINKGKELLLSKQKKFSKKENLFIDSYISYLWNESLKSYLKEKFKGYFLKENDINFFIPEDLDIKKISKFWTVLGYKVKLEESEKYYKEILKKEDIELEKFLEILKHKRIKGDYRRLYEKVENFSIKGKYVSFFLKKGAYATMLLKFLYTKNVIFKP